MTEKIIAQIFWVRTPTGLLAKSSITPDEYCNVVSIEGEYQNGERFVSVNDFDKPKITGKSRIKK